MSPQTREILINLIMSLAEAEHLIFLSDCSTCDREEVDAKCGTGLCDIWIARDSMDYAGGIISDVLEGIA